MTAGLSLPPQLPGPPRNAGVDYEPAVQGSCRRPHCQGPCLLQILNSTTQKSLHDIPTCSSVARGNGCSAHNVWHLAPGTSKHCPQILCSVAGSPPQVAPVVGVGDVGNGAPAEHRRSSSPWTAPATVNIPLCPTGQPLAPRP